MSKIKLVIFTLCIACNILSIQSQNYRVYGFVKDSISSEPLIGAHISSDKSYSISNENGYFSLTISTGIHPLKATFIGYNNKEIKFNVINDTLIEFKLNTGLSLNQHVVYGRDKHEPGSMPLSLKDVKNMPSIMGEHDILKSLQLLPGVQFSSEGKSELIIRGGNPDQLQTLIDDVPVHYLNHIGGFLSLLDINTLSKVDFYTGGFPAEFGGKLSGVLDVALKEGSKQKHSGNINIGNAASSLYYETPLRVDTSSLMISIRRCNVDLLTRPLVLIESEGIATAGYTFYDFTAKYSKNLSKTERLYFIIYGGRDKIFINADDDLKKFKYSDVDSWGNVITSIRYSKSISPKFFGNIIGSYSNYYYKKVINYEVGNKSDLFYNRLKNRSGLNELRLNLKFNYYSENSRKTIFGIWFSEKIFNTASQKKVSSSGNQKVGTHISKNYEITGYLEKEIEFGKFQSFLGLNTFWGINNLKSKLVIQPRAKVLYKLSENNSFMISYSKMIQDMSLFSNSGNNLPGDVWVPSSYTKGPSISSQLSLNYNYHEEGWYFSIETYYKKMKNLGLMDDENQYFSVFNMDNERINWNVFGTSYGFETFLERNLRTITGKLSYSWLKSDRTKNSITFPYTFDRRHNLTLFVQNTFSERFNISGVWIFATSRPYTSPKGYYQVDLPYSTHDFYNETIHYYGGVNQVRYDDYHRLDLCFNFIKKLKRGSRTWNITLYNTYNRFNGYYYLVKEKENSLYTIKKIAYFPFMPFISYSYKF